MIDDILFQRGHIDVRIGDRDIDDFDIVIPEFYFEDILGLTGEIVDSNGSDYELHYLDAFDEFDISFIVDPVEFEIDGGNIIGFDKLIVRCTGTIVPIDGKDVLDIDTYKMTGVSPMRTIQ